MMEINLEALLREALAPVEPPSRLLGQLETSLSTLHQVAQEELDGWELAAMSNPRNWARPLAAVVVASGAGAGLVALRVRGRHRARVDASSTLRDLAGSTLRDIAAEARRVLPERDR